jgi:O-antigen/teichoic acid export membrane protein
MSPRNPEASNGDARRRGPIAQAALLGATMLANAILALVAIPVVVSVAGAEGWAAIAVGQSVGLIAGVVSAMGWGYSGPTMIARSSASSRKAIFLESVWVRAFTVPSLAAAAAIVSAALSTPDHRIESALAAAGATIAGYTFSWYFVGCSRGDLLFVVDTVPRVGIWTGGLVVTVVTSNPQWYLATQALGYIVASALSTAVIARSLRHVDTRVSLRDGLRSARSQLAASTTVITSTLYMSAPTIVVSALAPTGLPAYAITDRLTRFALTATAPLMQALQSWVPHAGRGTALRRRMLVAVAVGSISGAIIFAGFALFGSQIAFSLSRGEIEPPLQLLLLLGGAALFSSVSRMTGAVCLMTLDMKWTVARSALVGAGSGVVLLIALTPAWGAAGAALGVVIAEAIVLSYQTVSLAREWHRA